MKAFLFALLVAAVAAPVDAGDLRLEIRDGRVTLDAKEVTVRQILAEWARVGQTKVINIERVASGTVTLQLTAVPERQALDTILRSISGYLAAPRPAGSIGASVYDRILVLPTSSVAPPTRPQGPAFPGAPAASGATNPPRVGQPPPGTPGFVLPEARDDQDDAPLARQPAPNRGIVTFGTPPPGLPDQPGTIVQQPSGPTDSQRAPANQTPQRGMSPSNPFNIPAGTTTPGIVTAPVQPQGAQPQQTSPTGPRQPQPDR